MYLDNENHRVSQANLLGKPQIRHDLQDSLSLLFLDGLMYSMRTSAIEPRGYQPALLARYPHLEYNTIASQNCAQLVTTGPVTVGFAKLTALPIELLLAEVEYTDKYFQARGPF